MYKYGLIYHECNDDDYITYKAYYYYKVLNDKKNAKKFYKEAIQMENTHAMHGLAMHYKRFDKYNKMIKYLKMAIKKNDSVAMIDYGNHFLFENNNINKAIKYYNMAKKNNHYRGYYELAYYFYEFKFNYKKCKENMLLFLDTLPIDIETYLDDLKLRGILFEKLISLILIHEYEENIDFLKPYCDTLGINITETLNKYKIKIQSKKQFKMNKEKINIDGECCVCYNDKKLYLFDCIGHYICNDCYERVDKCPFCSIMKHPLMMKNKNIQIDIPIDEITDETNSDIISDYESNSENSEDELLEEEEEEEDEDNNEEEDDEADDEENDNSDEENIDNIQINQIEGGIEENVIDENEHQDGGYIYTPPNERNEI